MLPSCASTIPLAILKSSPVSLPISFVVKNGVNKLGIWSFLEAANGQIALKIIADQRVDLIITDIDMPIKNGLELLEEVRRDNAGIPVVVMTGGNHNEKLILAAGASAFVQKPFLTDIGTIVRKMAAA